MKLKTWLVALLGVTALALPAGALGHARVSPAVSVAKKLQLYTLAVPTEKDGVRTTKVVMTVPSGFGIDSFAPPPPGWHQSVAQSGSAGSAVIQQVTWSGGRTPTGQDAVFQFLAQPSSAKTYSFSVVQTYSNGQVVSWTGPESSDTPAASIEAKSSLGGGDGVSTVSIIALVLAILALLASGAALLTGGSEGRPVA